MRNQFSIQVKQVVGVGFVNRKIDNSANQKENEEYRRRMKEIYGYDEDDLQ